MANIVLTIPDAQLVDVIDAICFVHKYDALSGLTKAQFAKNVLIEMVKNAYRSAKAAEIHQTHSATIATEIAAVVDPNIT
jgi:hypothetical protein